MKFHQRFRIAPDCSSKTTGRFVYALLFLLLFSWLFPHSSVAQVRVSFKLKLQDSTLTGPFYLAGQFNRWAPADTTWQFKKTSDGYSLNAYLYTGDWEFKCTRGSWETVETTQSGDEIENRIAAIRGDTTLVIQVDGWKNQFPVRIPVSTASEQVQLVSDSFPDLALQRTHRIWIYLPKNYKTSKKRYPVWYLMDGQNLFDALQAPYGEWGVDECLDTAAVPAIVVGIASGANRLTEYNLWNSQFGKAEGAAFLDFVCHELKPYIDQHFRTLKEPEHTAVGGSSMGGFIATCAILRHPDVFGKAALFSPSYWIAPQIDSFAREAAPRLHGKLYFWAGGKEPAEITTRMPEVAAIIGSGSHSMILQVTDPLGAHQEKSWRKWFAEAYRWLMADGWNEVTNRNE